MDARLIARWHFSVTGKQSTVHMSKSRRKAYNAEWRRLSRKYRPIPISVRNVHKGRIVHRCGKGSCTALESYKISVTHHDWRYVTCKNCLKGRQTRERRTT
jgi:hypothetical protein